MELPRLGGFTPHGTLACSGGADRLIVAHAELGLEREDAQSEMD